MHVKGRGKQEQGDVSRSFNVSGKLAERILAERTTGKEMSEQPNGQLDARKTDRSHNWLNVILLEKIIDCTKKKQIDNCSN